MSAIKAVADALVTALQDAGFEEAALRPIPYTQREDCATRRLSVLIVNQQYPDGHRGSYDDLLAFNIVLQKAMAPDSVTELATLLDDVAAVAALYGDSGSLRGPTLAGAEYDSGPLHPTGNLYEPDQLLELHLFTSVLQVRYRLEH